MSPVLSSKPAAGNCRINALPQLDGPHENQHRGQPRFKDVGPYHTTTSRSTTKSEGHHPNSAIRDLLPFCTAEAPLTEEQVVALSDMAGSLKEVMLLAIRAKTDDRVAMGLVRAVGRDAASRIVEFFTDEFEV